MSNKVNYDDLLTMSQDELESRYNTLDGYLKRESRRGRRHEDFEVESCYFFREIEWRNLVKKNHEEYLKKFRDNCSQFE